MFQSIIQYFWSAVKRIPPAGANRALGLETEEIQGFISIGQARAHG
jgi:hypothetical protein